MNDTVLIVDQKADARFDALNPTLLRSTEEAQAAFDAHRRRAFWIVPELSGMSRLTSLQGDPHGDRRLLLLARVEGARREVLHAKFRIVVALTGDMKLLPIGEIAEVLGSPSPEDLFIGGIVNSVDGVVVLYRGNLESLVVPLDWFASEGGPDADLTDFEITDSGQTVRFGEFEAASDAILYEFDPNARRRFKERALEEDHSFGGALRRLRKQRGIRREDFEGVSAKEIARLERGEVSKPQPDTLWRIAKTLGVRPEDVETY